MGRPMAERWWSPHTAMGRLDGSLAAAQVKRYIQEGQHPQKPWVISVRAGEERRGANLGSDQNISTTQDWGAKAFARLDSRTSSVPWFSLLECLVYWKSLLISLVVLNVLVKIVYPFDTTFIHLYSSSISCILYNTFANINF